MTQQQVAMLVIVAGAVLGCARGATRIDPEARQATTCRDADQDEIAALFDRWNASLRSGDPKQVSANYAADSILLPTLSNRPRRTAAEREDYFEHFLLDQPLGRIDLRKIDIGCNYAIDAGLYTFHFTKTNKDVHARYSFSYEFGEQGWLITSHHSSAMPEP